MTARTVSLRFTLLACALLVGACNNPFSNDDDTGAGPSNPDSVDAELGKNQLNRYDFLQGKFLATGQEMDLAIEGKGLFILKNQDQYVYFRRPGMFTQDSEGYLHLGNAKTRLQGIRIYSESNPWPGMPADTAVLRDLKDLTDVRWPFDDLAPPRVTSMVKLARNLDSDALGKGSILRTQKFMHPAQGAPTKFADPLISLFEKNGTPLGIAEGDVLTLSASKDGSTVTATLAITSASTVKDLTYAMQAFLRESAGAGLGTTVDVVAPGDSRALCGAISIYGNTASIANFQITSDRPASGPAVTKIFSVPADIPAGMVRFAVLTEPLFAPARPEDLLAEIYDSVGEELGLEEGDIISYSGAIGVDQAQNVAATVYSAQSTSMQDLMDKIRENFKLPERDGSIQNHPTVSLNGAGTNDNIPDGSLIIRGMPGSAFDIRDVSIRSTDANNSKPSPNFFNTNLNITTMRNATDDLVGICTFNVYDATGKAHPLTVRITPTNTPGSWLWKAEVAGDASLSGPSGGSVKFGADGSVTIALGRALVLDPGNGAAKVLFTLDFGAPGDFTGITQFRSATTVAAVAQDGFAPGRLTGISFGEDGVITGAYANGQTRPLFQLPLAGFPNFSGLKQVGENSFLETTESGKPKVSAGLDPAGGSIRSGAVEYVTEAERTKVCEAFPGC